MDNEISETETHHSRSQIDAFEDFGTLRAIDLKSRIEEMLRIKVNSSQNTQCKLEIKTKFTPNIDLFDLYLEYGIGGAA